MSAIEAKIQALLRKKNKIEILKSVLKVVENELGERAQATELGSGSENLFTEVENMFKTFVETSIKSIESSEDSAPVSRGHLSSQEISEIKTVATAAAKDPEAVTPFKPSDPQAAEDRKKKIEFAKSNQRLAGKSVEFNLKDDTLKGKVIGLSYPNLVIETENGTLEVSPDSLI